MRLCELSVGVVEKGAGHHEEESGQADPKGEGLGEILISVLHLGVDFQGHCVAFEGEGTNSEEVGNTLDVERLEGPLEGRVADVVNAGRPYGDDGHQKRG